MPHREIGYEFLSGYGLEVGAFLRPASLPLGCSVTYCDVVSPADSANNFPELDISALTAVDLITDLNKSGLACFASGSVDFVIFNQVIEHLANPIHAIEELFRVVRSGGMVVIATHDKNFSRDRKRVSPSFEDLQKAFESGVTEVADENYEAFLRVMHPAIFYRGQTKIDEALQTVRTRREHAYAWDSEAFASFLVESFKLLGITTQICFESRGEHNRSEYFAVIQKASDVPDWRASLKEANAQFANLAERFQKTQAVLVSKQQELSSLRSLFDQEVNAFRQHISLLDDEIAARREHIQTLIAEVEARGERMESLSLKLHYYENAWPQKVRRKLKQILGLPRPVTPALQPALPPLSEVVEPVAAPEPEDVESLPPEEEPLLLPELKPAVFDPTVLPHTASVDIIVCVHNALEDVKRCLSSLLRYTLLPYRLILVDDGSAESTRDFLAEFAVDQGAVLLRNDSAQGYTLAANQGLRTSSAEFVVLLNSDTIVSAEWWDRMVMCAASHPLIGMVGPLSNTASWQSVPEIECAGDWASNPLPEGVTLPQMTLLISHVSRRIYPRIPFLNGFCLLIKRDLIAALGYFDEAVFGQGYGEENDYCLRAQHAGWQLAIADDVYIYHAQSKSYSHERRKLLADQASQKLAEKHGQDIINAGVAACQNDRVLLGLRARARQLLVRQQMVDVALSQWEGKRVLFILPIQSVGGGANIIISEAQAMLAMGVDVQFLTLSSIAQAFKASYPELSIPILEAAG